MVNENSLRLNGRLAARWARRAVERLRRERGGINAINVFPVADGDTGSNMYATIKSAYRAVESLEGHITLARVVEAMANGALRGARGNSGLILSVALRGVADELSDDGELTADRFAAAIEHAASLAQDAIAEPTQGTMLTVLHAMADTARAQADAGAGLVEQIEAVRARSIEALRETTGQLDVLASAQVVDAGASGIVEIFDLLYLTVTGGAVGEAHSPTAGLTAVIPKLDAADCADGHAGAADALELVFRLADAKDRGRAVKRIAVRAGGTSVVVSWPLVHVHVAEEQQAVRILEECEQFGLVQLRTEDLINGTPEGRLRAVVLASTPQLMFRCALAGALTVRSGVQSTASLLEAALQQADAAVVTADTPEGAAAAAHCAARPAVHLVETGSPVALLSALAVFDGDGEPQAVAADMADAAAVEWNRICFAGKSTAGPLMYTASDVLVLAHGRIQWIAPSPAQAAVEAVQRMCGEAAEIITVALGRQCTDEMRTDIADELARAYPGAELELFRSGLSGVCADVGCE